MTAVSFQNVYPPIAKEAKTLGGLKIGFLCTFKATFTGKYLQKILKFLLKDKQVKV